MSVASNHYMRSQVHRSPRKLESINGSQDLTFLDQPWYYEKDDSWGRITASTNRSRWNEGESASSMSQLENTFEDSQQTLLRFVKSYSLHVIVAAVLYMFLFEVAVRLPFLLAFTFAIPSIHMLVVPAKPKSDDITYNNDSEALYRRSSIVSVVPGEPVDQYKTSGILHPVAVTFPGLRFFSPSTWFPRATDAIGF
ncbi:uncharacterized protein ALTATR162_LOCUS6072 [Alternaria atra]|uniref:Uncharacterized protein n=1 Tax=Alternaria atra TaxID=119953 RepID=A0A8J2I934_9PLEO|nr:uncharacterized protein ALTATR162_LOCUS6072 [Alternaria atra]CAG5161676.1 unnamed protein product [Alternaria atra]